MNKESECRELRKELKGIEEKLTKLEKPLVLDYQSELTNMNDRGWATVSAERGGPVRLKGVATYTILDIASNGSIRFDTGYKACLALMKNIVKLAEAVKNSHGY